MSPNGIKIRLRRRGLTAGVANVHGHRWRHNYAHEWKMAGGNTGNLMFLLGWTSEDMPRHYGASAAAERAQQSRRGWESVNVSDRNYAARREPLTAPQRQRRARIAAHQSWANTDDRTARTRPGTRAFLRRFERQVDPLGVLSDKERVVRARHARTAYMLQLAERSARARRRR